MRKLLFILIACAVSAGFAFPDDYWPRTYFVGAGASVGGSFGDLNDHTLSAVDSAGNKEKVYPPDLGLIFHPDFYMGVNIRDFSLAIAFQYQKMDYDLTKAPNDLDETESRIWRFGFEFTYNLFWPDPLQFGFGMGYSFTNLKTKKSAVSEECVSASELMGSALVFVLNAHYFFNDYMAIVPSIKFHETWFKSVYTKQSGTSDLDDYLWQSFLVGGIALQFQF